MHSHTHTLTVNYLIWNITDVSLGSQMFQDFQFQFLSPKILFLKAHVIFDFFFSYILVILRKWKKVRYSWNPCFIIWHHYILMKSPLNRYTFTVHYLKNYLMTKLLSHSITLTFNNSLKYICKYLRYICNLWTIPASAYIWKNRDYEKLVIPYTGGYGLFHTVLTEDILQ